MQPNHHQHDASVRRGCSSGGDGDGGASGAARAGESVRCFFRKELKYEMGRASALFLREEIARRLPLFEFKLGHPHTHIVTLYYDSEERHFFRKAAADYDNNVKVRVKDYYYCESRPPREGGASPDGFQGATLSSSVCFVELKRLVEGRVVKKRFALPKSKLARLVAGEDLWDMLLESVAPEKVNTLKEVYRELRDYLHRFRLRLTSIVTYRRVVFQEDEADLRITFDDQLVVHAPVPDPYGHGERLTPAALGAPLRMSDSVILEIKARGAYPQWLSRALEDHPARQLSKFTSSVRLLTDPSPTPASPDLPASKSSERASERMPPDARVGGPTWSEGLGVDETQDLGGPTS